MATSRLRPGLTLGHGFTLVELLVVIAIIGMLVALLLPAIQASRESARRSQCQSHLRQIGLAVQTHHDSVGHYPMGRNGFDSYSVAWPFFILPYLELRSIYASHVPAERADADVNATAMRTPIEIYACPSRRPALADRNFDNDDAPPLVVGVGTAGDYGANAGNSIDNAVLDVEDQDKRRLGHPNGAISGPIFTFSKVATRHVIDGQSNTLAVGEKFIPQLSQSVIDSLSPTNRVDWIRGDTSFLAGDWPAANLKETVGGLQVETDDHHGRECFGSEHAGVVYFVFLDGRVEGLNQDVDQTLFEALGTIGGSEVVAQK